MIRAVDSHVHLYPPEINRDPAAWAAAQGEAHWAALCTRRRRDGRPVQSFPAVGELLWAMDEAGIERAVLLGWYWEKPESCAAQNRFCAACAREHPDRLTAFAAVHPGAGAEAVRAEMWRARDEGCRGLGELSPHAQGCPLDHPALAGAFGLAAEWRWPVNLHVTDPAGRPSPGSVATPLEDFLATARNFPATTFVLAHWGGSLPLRLPGTAAPANVYYDTAASPLLYGPEIWPAMIDAAGADRVLFGSDFPLHLYPRSGIGPELARFVAEARGALAARDLSAVLRDNALRLLSGRPE